jgi:hypothetical protein
MVTSILSPVMEGAGSWTESRIVLGQRDPNGERASEARLGGVAIERDAPTEGFVWATPSRTGASLPLA